MFLRFLSLSLLIAATGCTAPDAPPTEPADAMDVTSLLGKTLDADGVFGDERKAELEQNLAEALKNFDADPSADNYIWLGRRQAYLWNYRQAIETFTAGMEAFPNDARMYRHRGHRLISVRDLDGAIADFERAAELIEGTEDQVEPDGAPNKYNIPTSSLHTNIWYHLGLAHYLKGDFEPALVAYRKYMEASTNNDSVVAGSDWLYMILRRLGRDAEAEQVLTPITADMEILENQTYLRRLLMYKGEIPPDSLMSTDGATDLDIATQGYGVGNWYLYNGEEDKAFEVFDRVLEGKYWSAFGYIAAEAELARKAR